MTTKTKPAATKPAATKPAATKPPAKPESSPAVVDKPGIEVTVPTKKQVMLVAALAAAAAVPKPACKARKAPKVKVERITKNGVTKPLPGLCLEVWLLCDALVGDSPTCANRPSVAQVKAAGEVLGLNATNCSVEYYQWAKHNGVNKRACDLAKLA